MLPTEQKPALPRSSVVMDGKKRQTSGKGEGADKAGDLQSRAVIVGALAPTLPQPTLSAKPSLSSGFVFHALGSRTN